MAKKNASASYLTFTPLKTYGKKTKDWNVHSQRTGTFLGGVRWYPFWRAYTFEVEKDLRFDSKCLTELALFLVDETNKHRAQQKAAKAK